MHGINSHNQQSQSGCCMPNLEITWTAVIKTIATIATGILGGAFVATGGLLPAGVGLLASVTASAANGVITGFGGYVITHISADLLEKNDKGGSAIALIIVGVIAVIGAVIGFFVGGGIFAATAAAFYSVGAASLLVMGGFMISDIVKNICSH